MYRALDLFCGAGGATKGLQMAGFHVTGVDNRPQPRYCGDVFHQADAMTFPLEGYDLIWASPPCQGYSRTRHLPWLKGKAHPLLIEPLRERFRHTDTPWVIENVGDAPLSGIELTGEMFGLPYRRLRRFESNFLILAPPPPRQSKGTPGRMFGNRLRKQQDQLEHGSQSVPPQYAKHIGDYAIMALATPGGKERGAT